MRVRRDSAKAIGSGWLTAYAVLVSIVGCASGGSVSRLANDFAIPQVRGGTFRLLSQPPRPVLLAFLQTVPDTADTASRSQIVSVISMAEQYGPRGLRTAVVDASATVNHLPPDHDGLLNASYDWQLNFPLLEDPDGLVAQRLSITRIPTIILFMSNGKIARSWQGPTSAASLAQEIERIVGRPLGRLPQQAR